MKICRDGKYIELTPEEIAEMEAERKAYESTPQFKMIQIDNLKSQLSETDYKAIKYAEGWMTEEEYAPIKAERQAIRDRINELESQL